MWGDNSFGQVGNGIAGHGVTTTLNGGVTRPYLTMEQIKNVWFEGFNSCTVYAETASGETYVWGEGYSAVPTKIEDCHPES